MFRYSIVALGRKGRPRVMAPAPKGEPLEALPQYPAHRIKDRTYAGNTGDYGYTDDHEPHDTL